MSWTPSDTQGQICAACADLLSWVLPVAIMGDGGILGRCSHFVVVWEFQMVLAFHERAGISGKC